MRIRSRRGFTLVEMIVAVVLTAAVIAAACTVLYLGTSSFHTGTENAVNQQKAALAESYLQRYASTAFTLSPSNEEGSDGILFSLANGVLTIRRQTAPGGAMQTVAAIDGIRGMELKIDDGTLNYTIVSADGTYRLAGGIVLNNFQGGSVENLPNESDSSLFLGMTSSEAAP